MPQSGDTFPYSSGSFPQFDHTSMADAHADWKELKSLMQSAMHSVVLGHILADHRMLIWISQRQIFCRHGFINQNLDIFICLGILFLV